MILPHDTENGQGQFRIACPNCNNEKKKCYVDGRGSGIHCFHCKFSRTWRAFQRMYEPPTPEEVALETFLATTEQILRNDPVLMEWFRNRGLIDETIQALRFGFVDPDKMPEPTQGDFDAGLIYDNGKWVLANRITIPYIRDGYPQDFRGRENPLVPSPSNGEKKYVTLAGHSRQLYYPSEIDPEHPVIVTEGEFDAAILRQNGIQAVGCPGANAATPDMLKKFRSTYIAFDADGAGREGRDKLIAHSPEIRRIDLPEGYDVSDYVTTFGIESFRNLIDKAVFYLYGKPQKEDRFSTIVDEFVDWSWTNGELLGPKMGPWAPRLEHLLSGWTPGLILIGAEAHQGKSNFMIKALYELVMENPDDTIGVYLSLDDTLQEAMKRLVSLHTHIDFNDISRPRQTIANDPEVLSDYEAAMAQLKQIPNIVIRDATYGRSLRYLRNFFESLRSKYPEKRIVVFADSLAKITADTGDEDADVASTRNNWKAYLASELKYLTTKYSICLVTPTDLRKLNGAKRPTRDDLKDAAELAYEAQVILLMYNDLKKMRDDAVLFWIDEFQTKQPILEIATDKNKFTGRTETIRYKMIGEICEFWELTKGEDDDLTRMVQQHERERQQQTR